MMEMGIVDKEEVPDRSRSQSVVSEQTAVVHNGRGGHNLLLITLIVVVGVLALFAVILGAIALTRRSPGSAQDITLPRQTSAGGAPVTFGVGQPMGSGGRTWTIAMGHDWGAHEYFDEKGYIQGFSKEFVNAVCNAGGMDCQTVWMPYSSCWRSDPGQHPFGGEGLMDRWVDACTGYAMTVDRKHVFDFSASYLSTDPSYFFVKKDANFDTSDLAGKTIGFLEGWFTDEKCLARQEASDRRNYILQTNQIFYAVSPDDIIDHLLSGKIDAVFAGYSDMAKFVNNNQVKKVSGLEASCDLGGTAMMFRRDSDFNMFWNSAFQILKSSGGFQKLCTEARKKHELQGSISCDL